MPNRFARQSAPLDRATSERPATAQLTYPTALGDQGSVPDGYASISRTADLGSVDFVNTADALRAEALADITAVRRPGSRPRRRLGRWGRW